MEKKKRRNKQKEKEKANRIRLFLSLSLTAGFAVLVGAKGSNGLGVGFFANTLKMAPGILFIPRRINSTVDRFSFVSCKSCRTFSNCSARETHHRKEPKKREHENIENEFCKVAGGFPALLYLADVEAFAMCRLPFAALPGSMQACDPMMTCLKNGLHLVCLDSLCPSLAQSNSSQSFHCLHLQKACLALSCLDLFCSWLKRSHSVTCKAGR